MSLPIVKVSKYDLLMNNIPVTLATEECLIVLEDTGKVIHWNPQEYFEMWTNEWMKQYNRLVKQITPATQNIGCGDSADSYSGGVSTSAELRYTSRKEAIDTYSRMMLKVDGKHTLCLSCGRFIYTPKIGKYNDRYCESCGCYLPDSMFGKE